MYRVLLSGGMDSAVCLAWAKTQAATVECLFFDYGQRHLEREWAAAQSIARAAGVVLRRESLALPKATLNGEGDDLSPAAAVVPGRNRMFLLRAALRSPRVGHLVIGSCADDAAAFPDCRPLFYEEMRHLMRPVRIHTPLIDKTKAEVLAAAQRFSAVGDALNVDAEAWVEMSWSCYRGGEKPCGRCGACTARAMAYPCEACKVPAGTRCHHPAFGWCDPCPSRIKATCS